MQLSQDMVEVREGGRVSVSAACRHLFVSVYRCTVHLVHHIDTRISYREHI